MALRWNRTIFGNSYSIHEIAEFFLMKLKFQNICHSAVPQSIVFWIQKLIQNEIFIQKAIAFWINAIHKCQTKADFDISQPNTNKSLTQSQNDHSLRWSLTYNIAYSTCICLMQYPYTFCAMMKFENKVYLCLVLIAQSSQSSTYTERIKKNMTKEIQIQSMRWMFYVIWLTIQSQFINRV